MTGSDIGPYRVVRELGSGGMGTVLLAEDTRLHRQVALKTLHPTAGDPQHARHLLLREARAAASLSHPHIAAVHDVLDVEGEVAIVFEYCEGETLGARLGRGALPTADVLRIGSELADALAAAHAHGVVHRDLKPGNVMVAPDGSVKVLDFGVARMLPREHTTTVGPVTTAGGALVGTPGYAAPEQWLGQPADARADLYALGVVLFEMAAGRRPFEAANVFSLGAAALERPAPRLRSAAQGVPAGLDDLVATLLTREPDARPGDARAVAETLRRLQQDLTHLPASHRVRPGRWGWAFAVVLLLAIGTSAATLWPRAAPRPREPRPPVVAVLPLANSSGDRGNDYLAAGVGDSLVIGLASLSSVTVLSRAAVTEARTRRSDPAGLARDLDASYLVEGSVQQVGDTVRLSLTLLRPDGSVAWGDSVEGLASGLFELQARLASALTRALQVRLSAQERTALAEAPTQEPDALRAYWQGRAFLERRDQKGNLDNAIAAFAQAVAADPAFALAHAALGEAYWAQYNDTRERPWVDKAIASGTTALRLDPQQPEVRYALALTLAGSGRRSEAVEELQRALALRPTYEDARRELGRVLAREGRLDEAVAELRTLVAQRPGNWRAHSALGLTLLEGARYADAIASFAEVTRLQPDSFVGYAQLGAAYQSAGDDAAALEQYEHVLALSPNPQTYSNVGAIRHKQGDYAGAVEAYLRAITMRPNSHVAHRNLGDAYLRLGDPERSRVSYRKAADLAASDLQVNPRDARTSAALAVYLAKLGLGAEADRRMSAAVSLAPDDPEVLFRKAIVAALLGRDREAVAASADARARGISPRRLRDEEDLERIRSLPQFVRLTSADDVTAPGGPR